LSHTTKVVLRYWLPPAVLLVLIAIQSTDTMSAQHTAAWLAWLLKQLGKIVPAEQLNWINFAFRKSGHVIGYALLSALFFRAQRGTWREVRNISWPEFVISWRPSWATASVFFAFIVATADEMHQKMLASRGGSWHDVLLDSTAAIGAQLLILLFLKLRAPREHKFFLHSRRYEH
jgi:VanZ family protein